MRTPYKLVITLLILCLATALVACGGTENLEQAANVSTDNSAELAAESNAPEKTRLNADFDDAMSVQAQLVIGTLQLENGENAIDEGLAAELLPLWQAVQALSQSETSATAEVNAVINQIQDTMQSEQVQEIADMQLTNDGLQAMIESGEIQLGRPGGRGQGGQGGQGQQGGGQGGAGRGGGQLGPPPGGGAGGGQGLGNLSEDEIATRRAERFGGGGGGANPGLTAAVVRLLQQKTGVEVEPPRGGFGGPRGIALDIVSEQLGLSAEAIREQSADKTLLAIIEENGGDVDAIRAALSTALSDGDFPAIDDPDATAQDMLEGTFAGGGRPQQQGDQ